MQKVATKDALISALKEASEVFRYCSKKLKVLSTLSWGSEVADEFLKKGANSLPKPNYDIDIDGLARIIQDLVALTPKLKGDHPVFDWLRKTQQSYIQGARLLLEIGNDRFYEISTELYGNSQSKLFNSESTNADLARSISARMSVCNLNDISESVVQMDGEEFAAKLETRLKARTPVIPVRVEFSDRITAKVVAGMNRVRIRRGARFSESDVRALWNHEIESHCLTANNGVLQENCDFLCCGGPRTTLTQEGLAVFFEMYGHALSQRRFLVLCDRVHAVEMAENGADFVQLYRWYRERCDTDMDAFFSASRIFRGAKLTGGAPFTKDTVYIAGLLGVFNFLRIAVKNQNRLLIESLVCGRLALEDVGTVTWLRTHGVIQPPKFVPQWLENWEALLSFFSFNAFLNSVELSSFQSYFDTQNHLQDWDFSF